MWCWEGRHNAERSRKKTSRKKGKADLDTFPGKCSCTRWAGVRWFAGTFSIAVEKEFTIRLTPCVVLMAGRQELTRQNRPYKSPEPNIGFVVRRVDQTAVTILAGREGPAAYTGRFAAFAIAVRPYNP